MILYNSIRMILKRLHVCSQCCDNYRFGGHSFLIAKQQIHNCVNLRSIYYIFVTEARN
jgi:hypothetical protein